MAWSYRNDSCDEIYTTATGPTIVDNAEQPPAPAQRSAPRDTQHAKEMLDPKLTEKRLKEEEKFKEEQQKTADNAPKQAVLDQERTRIRTEEQQKLEREEHEKELDKIRKEEAENVKKAAAESKKETNEGNKTASMHKK